MSQSYATPYTAAQADVAERAGFIRRVYAHLAGAILALIAIEAAILQSPIADAITGLLHSGGRMGWLLVIGGFGIVTWMASNFASTPQNKGLQYVGLGISILAYAVILVPILNIAQTYKPGAITDALVCTGALFGGLTMVAFFTRADFSFFRSFLMIGGFVALAAIVCSTLFNFDMGIWFSAAMVIFFSISILYNTSNIIHEYGTDQHVGAAVSLFGSVVMLFWYILQIFMSRD